MTEPAVTEPVAQSGHGRRGLVPRHPAINAGVGIAAGLAMAWGTELFGPFFPASTWPRVSYPGQIRFTE